jgi:aspartate aminotransferase
MTPEKGLLSECALRVPVSGTLRMSSLAKKLEAENRKIIHLGIGQPNFNTPAEVIKAAHQAMLEGKTGYTGSKGITPLLEKIAQKHSESTGVTIDPSKNIIVTPGAKASLFAAMVSLVNPQDNLLLISPYWTSYQGIATYINAKVKTIRSNVADYSLPLESIKESIDNRTRLLVLNSPSNPTGAIYDKKSLKAIADLAIDHNIMIISDEIYKTIIFEGNYHQYLSIANSLEKAVIVDGFSKSHAMTGWRIGYTIANETIIAAMNKIQQNTTTCVNAPTQWAAITALDLTEPVTEMVNAYKERRDKAMAVIDKCEFLSCIKPQGAFYLFIRYNHHLSSEKLALDILNEKGVSITPGSVFGVDEPYIRLSLASDLEDIIEGLERINSFIAEKTPVV